MTNQPRSNDAGKQGDLLLWVAGGVVAAVGVAWLVIMKPWAGGDAEPAAQAATAPVVLATAAPPPGETADEIAVPEGNDVALDNPLHMAELAYQAGMLVEPEEYSAWTLYSRVVKSEPGNAAAVEGLTKVADDLVRRGETALEQGRFDDARAAVERIHAVLPAHPGAKALSQKIWPAGGAQSESAAEFKPEIPVQAPPPKVEPVKVVQEAPAKPAVDPLAEANESFEEAMAASRLLTPADQSAKHFIGVMLDVNPLSDLTRKARERLSREFLARATQSLAALDTEAALIWIDEADSLGVDANGVRNARGALIDQQIALESAKPLPASSLKVLNYVKPVYPARANERQLEGWVDVEFTVMPDGTTRDVTIANASHETFFRREAVAAVEQWKFEPRVFMNRAIEQRSFTRIRFVQ
jgi:TonB family protein